MGAKYTIGSMRRMYRPEAGRGSMRGARRTGKGQGRETACIKNPPFFIICTTVSRLIPGALPGKPETELEQGPDKMLFYRDFVDRKVRFLYNKIKHIQLGRKLPLSGEKSKNTGCMTGKTIYPPPIQPAIILPRLRQDFSFHTQKIRKICKEAARNPTKEEGKRQAKLYKNHKGILTEINILFTDVNIRRPDKLTLSDVLVRTYCKRFRKTLYSK